MYFLEFRNRFVILEGSLGTLLQFIVIKTAFKSFNWTEIARRFCNLSLNLFLIHYQAAWNSWVIWETSDKWITNCKTFKPPWSIIRTLLRFLWSLEDLWGFQSHPNDEKSWKTLKLSIYSHFKRYPSSSNYIEPSI